jgi:hypothetical protein
MPAIVLGLLLTEFALAAMGDGVGLGINDLLYATKAFL